MEKIYGKHKLVGLQLFLSGTPTFSSGTPTFCQMAVLNSCFQNPSESSGQLLVGPAGDCETQVVSARCLMNLSGHLLRPVGTRDRSSLLLFHKIHSGAVSIEKDKYLIPAHSLKSTRSSHSAQYCR